MVRFQCYVLYLLNSMFTMWWFICKHDVEFVCTLCLVGVSCFIDVLFVLFMYMYTGFQHDFHIAWCWSRFHSNTEGGASGAGHAYHYGVHPRFLVGFVLLNLHFFVQCLIGHCLSLWPLSVIHQLATSYYFIWYHQSSLTIAVVTVLGTPMLSFMHTERRLTKGQQPVNHCLLAIVLSVLHRLTASYCPFVILKWNIKLKIKGNSIFIS